MPIADFEKASKKVDFERNPFQEPSKSEIGNINSLNLTVKFKGLAKTGDKINAIMEINDDQKFYQIGDTLDNGFIIKAISYKNTTVDITNGSKSYRLSLNKLNNKI